MENDYFVEKRILTYGNLRWSSNDFYSETSEVAETIKLTLPSEIKDQASTHCIYLN